MSSVTPAQRARARTEARRLLGLAADGRRRAQTAQDPGAAAWERYVADQRVQQAREALARVGDTIEHLQPRPVPAPTPLRARVVHLDDRTGSGVAACGADIYPRVRLDLAPAASSWPGFYTAVRLGSACPECLGEVEADNSSNRSERAATAAEVR